MTKARETRTVRAPETKPELRAKGEGERKQITAHAAVFNRYSQNLGGFVEMIDPKAFNRTLANGVDAVGLINHDPNLLLGRRSAETLVLEVDEIGLRYTIDPPDTQAGRDAVTSIGRGDLTGSSFSFRVTQGGADWSETEQGVPLRIVREVELYDVGPVTFPAYLDTASGDSQVALRHLAKKLELPYEQIEEAAKRNVLGQLLNDAEEEAEPASKHLRSSLSVIQARAHNNELDAMYLPTR